MISHETYPAFYHWLSRASGSDRSAAAGILRDIMFENPNNEILWDLLSATGDASYNFDTFLKAADIALSYVTSNQK